MAEGHCREFRNQRDGFIPDSSTAKWTGGAKCRLLTLLAPLRSSSHTQPLAPRDARDKCCNHCFLLQCPHGAYMNYVCVVVACLLVCACLFSLASFLSSTSLRPFLGEGGEERERASDGAGVTPANFGGSWCCCEQTYRAFSSNRVHIFRGSRMFCACAYACVTVSIDRASRLTIENSLVAVNVKCVCLLFVCVFPDFGPSCS